MCCLSNEQSRNYSVITLSGTAWFPLALGRWHANQGPRSAKMSHFSSLCTKPASSFLGTAVDINCIAGCFPARCWRKTHSHKSSLGVFTLVGSKSLVLISEQSGWAGWGSEGSPAVQRNRFALQTCQVFVGWKLFLSLFFLKTALNLSHTNQTATPARSIGLSLLFCRNNSKTSGISITSVTGSAALLHYKAVHLSFRTELNQAV